MRAMVMPGLEKVAWLLSVYNRQLPLGTGTNGRMLFSEDRNPLLVSESLYHGPEPYLQKGITGLLYVWREFGKSNETQTVI